MCNHDKREEAKISGEQNVGSYEDFFFKDLYYSLYLQRLITSYSLSVQGAERGQHVYKQTWNPYKGEKLIYNHENQKRAAIFEDHAVGTYGDLFFKYLYYSLYL